MTDPQLESINTIVKETGLKQSEIIRRALDEYIEKYHAKKNAPTSK